MQEPTKHIYIVRHGETDYNRRGLIQGSGVDAPLNETGRLQARAFYERYQEQPFEVVLTSRLQRTHQTMQPFLDTGLPWEQYAEINEMCWGEHEGKASTPEMIAEYQAIKAAWSAGDYDVRIRDGESAREMAQRLRRFVDLLWQRPERYILICSHGRAMCGLITVMKNHPLYTMNDYQHSNTGLWLAHPRETAYHFALENDLSHLQLVEQLLP